MKQAIRNEIASNIKKYRNQKNLSQVKFANELGLHRSAVEKWEAGISMPNEESTTKICSVLGIKLEELLAYGDSGVNEVNTNILIHINTIAENALKSLNANNYSVVEKCLKDILDYSSDKIRGDVK